MMRLNVRNIIVLVALTAGVSYAQQAEVKPKKPKPKGEAYLAGGQYGSGSIPLAQFDSLIGKPLIARDTLGRFCPVIKFDFTFAERGLYEDSTGRLTIMTDYYVTPSDSGALLPPFWIEQLKRRAKIGDTVYFDQILAEYPDSVNAQHFYTHPLKLVISE